MLGFVPVQILWVGFIGAAPVAADAGGLETVGTWRGIETAPPGAVRLRSVVPDGADALWALDDGAGGFASVWRLRDRDGDRRFETADEFAGGLMGAIAVWPDGEGGVLVLEPPNLVRLRDTDGDGRAETSRILVRVPEATGLAGGSDGWVRLIGAGRSVRVGGAGRVGETRRSWPFFGSAAERGDGSWLGGRVGQVILVLADDHAIVRNPEVPAPWGSVVSTTVTAGVTAVAPHGSEVLLVEGDAIVRRSVSTEETRLTLGEPEPVARIAGGGPMGLVAIGNGEFVVTGPTAVWILRDESGKAPAPLAPGPLLPDPMTAVLAAGDAPDATAFPLFRKALAEAGTRKQVRDAVVAGLGRREVPFLRGLLADPPLEPEPLRLFVSAATASVLEANRPADTRDILSLAAGSSTSDEVRAAMLERILAATDPHGRRRRELEPDAEPTGWRALVATADPNAVAADAAIRWPGRADLPPLPDPDADLDAVAYGQRIYAICLTCHGSGGRGQPGIYPPLRESDWVAGDPERLVKIVLHGLTGPIRVNGERYASVMQVPRPLDDREISAVLTYVRQAWGNDAPPVSEEQVRAIRAATAGRTTPWTEAELGGAP